MLSEIMDGTCGKSRRNLTDTNRRLHIPRLSATAGLSGVYFVKVCAEATSNHTNWVTTIGQIIKLLAAVCLSALHTVAMFIRF